MTKATKATKIQISGVTKLFGPDPQPVMEMLRQGMAKAEILERTGHIVGIHDISLQVEPGEIFVVMGLSGSGKSTLIRHINRLVDPTAGQILIDGEDILAFDDQQLRELRRRKMSMVFQRFGLLPHRTVQENVAYGLEMAGQGRAAAHSAAEVQIELVGLEGYGNSYPSELSGGMQQRVGLARALASDPEILLMDEAFSALDPLIRNDMQEQLLQLQGSMKKTIVFITHDLDEALRLGDHIAILKDGEVRQVGTGPEILLNPADDYVERFVRDVNRARVIKLGTISETVAVMPLRKFNDRTWRQALGDHPAIVLTEDGEPVKLVTRDLAYQDEFRATEYDNLPDAVYVDPESTIEEGMAILARADGPVITEAEGEAEYGIVESSAVLEAMIPGSGEEATGEETSEGARE